MRQRLGALLGSAFLSLGAGLALGLALDLFTQLPGLMLLLPGAVGLRGNIFGTLAARLGTGLHSGLLSPEWRGSGRRMLVPLVVAMQQTILLGLFLCLREPAQLKLVLTTWRMSALVGITGVLGSAGWFTAMTLQNAAYVRTLGQVELILTFLASHYLFRERIRKLEVIGVLLIVASIVLLLNFR